MLASIGLDELGGRTASPALGFVAIGIALHDGSEASYCPPQPGASASLGAPRGLQSRPPPDNGLERTKAMMVSVDHVVFIGESTSDFIVQVDPGHEHSGRVVQLVDDSAASWGQRCGGLSKLSKGTVLPGGSSANTCASFADASPVPRIRTTVLFNRKPMTSALRAPLHWPGYSVSRTDLTARGVMAPQPDPLPQRPELPGAIAYRNPRSGEVYQLTIASPSCSSPVPIAGDLRRIFKTSCSVAVVLRSDHLSELLPVDQESLAVLAILVADVPQLRQDLMSRLSLQRRDTPLFLFGDVSLLPQMRALTHGRPYSELVGMNGGRPCVVIDQHSHEHMLEVTAIKPVCDLGAGDAYTGGYLASRLQGGDIVAAHAMASQQACKALLSFGARVPRQWSLAGVLPQIGRSSPDLLEGALYEGIRTSPGISILSGGQTGVDQLAAAAARRLELPVHMVLPKGWRTEDGTLNRACLALGGSRFWELESESYRYRTWATAYFADAIVLVDPVCSEGSAETRKAADYFGRPTIELDINAQTWRTCRKAMHLLSEHSPRVLLIAGNRRSHLSARSTEAVRQHLSALLACVATYLSHACRGATIRRPRRIANPLPVPFALLDRLREELRAGTAHGHIELIGLRARDIARGLASGRFEHGVTWPSLVSPDAHDRYDVSPLGMAPVFYGLGLRSPATSLTGMRVACQYELNHNDVETELIEGSLETIAVSGKAESWVQHGLADCSYDTWVTGSTASQFGIRALYPSHWETLSFLRRRTPKH